MTRRNYFDTEKEAMFSCKSIIWKNKVKQRKQIITLIILIFLFLFASITLAASGIPHLIYGKVFNSDGSIPIEDNIKLYAYIPARPGEILNKSSVGCGYGIWMDGWLWFEAGNFLSPWSIDEGLRVIVINNFLQETGVIDLKLDSSGNQLLSDLKLNPGDNVGPIASNALADGLSPLTIPEGTASIDLTATIDDSITGNSNIQGAEYYIDSEPGLGSGTAMDVSDGFFDSPKENVEALVDTHSWTEGSTHTIYVRGKDVAGNWGPPHMVVVSVGAPFVPENTPGSATGGGWFMKGRYRCPFQVDVSYTEGEAVPAGFLKYQDQQIRLIVTSVSITSFIVSDNKATIKGECTVNRSGGYTFVFEATDGLPDSVSIEIKDAGGETYYTASGSLAYGDVQVNKY